MSQFIQKLKSHPKFSGCLLIFLFFVFLSIIIPDSPDKPSSNPSQPAPSIASSTTSPVVEKISSVTTTQQTPSQKTDVVVAPKTSTSTPTTPPAVKITTVVKVIDGDTMDVSDGQKTFRLRLIGIDTPETKDPRKPVQCFGIEASNKAKELLLNKQISLEYDSSQGTLDKYGRTLAYIFLSDGTHYNKWMILNGYAHEYTYNLPYKYQAEFKSAENVAKSNLAGLWNPSTCGGETAQAVPTTPSVPTEQTTIPSTDHTFYTSSHYNATYYYCDTDDGWTGLSEKYLKSFSSESELLAKYIRVLHEPCK